MPSVGWTIRRVTNTPFSAVIWQPPSQPTDADPTNLLAGSTATLDFLVQSVGSGDTYLIGSGTVSSFRATVNRTRIPVSDAAFRFIRCGNQHLVGVPKLLRIAMTNI